MKHIKARIEILSLDEIEQIHDATLEVLASVGCHLPHRRVLDRLASAGAEVDYGTARAKLPPGLVEEALSSVTEGRRITPELKFEAGVLRGERVTIGPGNQANIVDYQAKERRQGTTEDVIKGIVLCNELPYVRSAMPLVTPADVPQVMGDLYGYYLCALYSRKPYGVYIMTPEAARQIMRIAEIRAEGERPYLGYLLEPNGALSYDDYSLEMALTFVEAGHGFHAGPMSMAGLDAPVTLAGTLVMQNASNLIAIVIAHLWGTRCGWSGSAHTLDLRSSLCSFGSPNQVLLGLAAVQLGNWYGFEVGANCALTDACLPDFQGGFEKGMSAMAMLLAGAGYGAQGIVGADQGTSLEQLVIDNEWASALDHIFSHGVEVNEETLAVDVIRRVGIQGSFLADEHTVRHMRDTYWRSTIFNHECWDAWMAKGGKDVYARAHERVEEILAAHYPPEPLVSEPVRRELDALIAEAMAHPERFQVERYRYHAGR
ncbi:MAG: trimethylamine methyltransferase family protein [Anaerolineae bacterium]|nr:trimethylamine methyltransferase family protein [Anaerolineae bacterium]